MHKHIEIEKDQLKDDLRTIGIEQGSHVAIALSFKSIGFVKGGPDAFIDALLEVVGSEGTIMMNTYTSLFPLSEVNPFYVFDCKSTLPWTGIVPRTLMKRANSIRSRHPVTSIVAIGKLAKYLTDGNNETAENDYLPYAKLAKVNGKYLSIGLNDNLVAIRHEAQRRAGLFIVPKYSGVLYKNSNEVNLYVFHNSPCIKNQPKIVPKLEEMGIIKRGRIGMADSVIASADKLIDAISAILRENPTLNLCNDVFCLECRELERRMSLYGQIQNPRIFQKNMLIRQILRLRNKIVLKRYSHVSFKNSKREKISSLSVIMEVLILHVTNKFLEVFKK